MSSVDKLTKLADRFARKLSLAQVPTAQAGDIENALKAAGLWERSAEVAPLLNQAGVADDASVAISIMVDSKLDVKYHVQTQPPAAAIKLAGLLRARYAQGMKGAIQAAKLAVAETITLNWLHF